VEISDEEFVRLTALDQSVRSAVAAGTVMGKPHYKAFLVPAVEWTAVCNYAGVPTTKGDLENRG
jgi:hypothetical protein